MLAEHILELNKGARSVRVQLSLEGATREINDEVRGHKSFDYAMESLKIFSEIGLAKHVVIFVCLTSRNIHQLQDIVRLAEEFRVGMLVFSQWQKQGNASNLPWASISPSQEEWIKAGEFILNYKKPGLKVFGNFFGDITNDSITRYNLDSQIFPKHSYYFNVFPRISATGDVWADQLWVDKNWILGNIRDVTLDDCMESPRLVEQLNKMRHRKIPECLSCIWKGLCEGGSPGHTYAEYDGDMNHRDLFCGSRVVWFERFAEYQLKRVLGDDVVAEFKRPPEQKLSKDPNCKFIRVASMISN